MTSTSIHTLPPTPITILTGFLGAGKTTILLNLLPQLPKTYRLALLKNEFGDVAVDSRLFDQLASRTVAERIIDSDDERNMNGNGNDSENEKKGGENAISGVKELLNGCICCNLVGQLGDALVQLRREYRPDRIFIETSGSAFPATLAMEVNRLAREGVLSPTTTTISSTAPPAPGGGGRDVATGALSSSLSLTSSSSPLSPLSISSSPSLSSSTDRQGKGRVGGGEEGGGGREKAAFVLDGVISVIDVENWEGYDDTSYTAKLQARYTDLVIFNKWEGCGERRFDICLDRLGDLDADTPWVKSDRGRVDKDLLLGIDGALLVKEGSKKAFMGGGPDNDHPHNHHDHHSHHHQSEVEVLSLTLTSTTLDASINLSAFMNLLQTTPREEVYRIKGIIHYPALDCIPQNSDPEIITNMTTTTTTTTAPTIIDATNTGDYILNWAFGRWTFTPILTQPSPDSNTEERKTIARLTFILARYEAGKWLEKLQSSPAPVTAGNTGSGNPETELVVQRLL